MGESKKISHKKWAVLLNGDLSPTQTLCDHLEGRKVIAADGGIRHASDLGVEPDLWVGDFDSTDADLLEHYRRVPKLEFPAEKDAGDSELAIEQAMKGGAEDLIICGLFGASRPEHFVFNLTQVMARNNSVCRVWGSDGSREYHPLTAGVSSQFDFPPGTSFSIVALSALKALTIEGARWPLDERDIPFGSTITLSNVVHAQLRLHLHAGLGTLIVNLR
ncbi:MAG: thiamine diphosphokinase [Pseudomonadota bacterium]